MAKNDKDIISHHTFMFPFTIEEDEFDLKKTVKILEKNKWEYIPFDVEGEQKDKNKIFNYNEFVYFYPAVQKLLYNQKDKIDKLDLSVYLINKQIKENAKYIIKILNEKEYELEISGVAIRIFKTGVGILLFHLENYKYEERTDILKINDFGRRIYPQFIPVESAKANFLAKELEIENIISEDFYNYLNGKNIRISKTIRKLIGDELSNKIKPLIDDRMFTICWYGNDEFSEVLKKYNNSSKEYNYFSNEDWAKFLFIDGNFNSLKSKNMIKEYLKKYSYDRWIEEGTLFGISRYSFVVATNERWFPKNILLSHIKTMYYQIMIIVLMQRATILKFKNKISKVMKEENIESIRRLQKEYLEFLNLMNFREVTAQEQGIEIYNMVRDIMGINDAVRELEKEIYELYNYYSMLESEKRLKQDRKLQLRLNIITILGGAIGIASLINSIIGMDRFKDILDINNKYELFIKGGFFVIIPFIITILILYNLVYESKKNKENIINKIAKKFQNEKWSLTSIIILFILYYIFIIA
ncbi:hypothetical protein [Haliovirga abyssi]|uniref:Uncharacterized protein n=1 Tax=Haliovirga abyssi TaxID=2996794 RepID=A0AAU9DUE5_9FUSO|nr:hypothetical protein [Haliovirga abyssi]BDU50904.1 hypothetical protein HLVA_14730 [Haliovirga abyssi]